jgi:heme exporter protein A
MFMLSLRQLACRRGERVLFSKLDLDLPAAQLVWVRARNGSGKTTLLRAVCGLIRPDAGQVLWGDEPVQRSFTFRQCLTFLGHAQALKDDLTALETLCFWAQLHGHVDVACLHTAAQAALHQFEMAACAKLPIRVLSQGQRRRVVLARLLLAHQAHPQGVWILDEPFDALDAQGALRLTALLAAHVGQGGRVLMTSHQAFDAEHLRPVVLDLDAHLQQAHQS